MYRQAEGYYKNAVTNKIGGNITYLHYAQVLRANGKYDEAIKNYKAYLDSVPGNITALHGMESSKIAKDWLSKKSRYVIGSLKDLNSFWSDYSAAYIGGHDNEIYFTSTRRGGLNRKLSAITGDFNADIYKTTFNQQKKRWEKPKLVEENNIINTLEEEGGGSFNAEGNIYYFTRCPYDISGEKGTAIYSATELSGVWGTTTKIGLGSDSLMAAHPSLSGKGDTLYFVSDRPGGFGEKDIWYAVKNGEKFGKPVNAGPQINTPGNEMFPFIRDNGMLYFSSDGQVGLGGLDIFAAKKDNQGKWVVENMKAPVNSTGDDFSISYLPGEDRGLFSTNRSGTRKDDIYTFYLPPKVYEMEGNVFNKETGAKINDATVKLIGTDGTMLRVNAEKGKFKFKLKPEVEYVVAGYKKGFLNSKSVASTVGMDEGKQFQVKLELAPVDIPISVDNIYFAFSKWDLLPESMTALDSLAGMLTLNPTVVIELMAHTDCRGDDATNSTVSQKRAQSVVTYLVSKGIQAGRLVAKGYGETAPKTVTKEIAKQYPFLKAGRELTCTFIESLKDDKQKEICHQINRRTEFKVLSSDYKEKFEK